MINKVIFEFEFTILINFIFFKLFIWDLPTLKPLQFLLKKFYFQKCHEVLLLQFYQQVPFRTSESRQVKSRRTWLWSNNLFWKYIATVIQIFYLVFYYSFAEASKFFSNDIISSLISTIICVFYCSSSDVEQFLF